MRSIKIENAALSDDIMTVQQISSYIEPTFMHKDGTVDEGTIQISGNYIQTTDSYTKAYGRNSFIQAEAVLNTDGITLKYQKPSAGTKGWVILGLDKDQQAITVRGKIDLLNDESILNNVLFSISIDSKAITDFTKISSVQQLDDNKGKICLTDWNSSLDDYVNKTEDQLLDMYKYDDNGFFTFADSDLGHEELLNFYGQHVEGGSTKAVGKYAHAEGRNSTAGQRYAHAEGNTCKALGASSHAEGQLNMAYGQASHVEGSYCSAFGNYSHAEGNYAASIANGSHAEGHKTSATGLYSHAEGLYTNAYGDGSHVEGSRCSAFGNYSHAEGNYTASIANYSHAEGNKTSAYVQYCHVEGALNAVYGEYSHSEGKSNIICSDNCHAEGYNCTIKSYSTGSHIEGYTNTLSGIYSNVEGSQNNLYGRSSHLQGYSSELCGNFSFGSGSYISAHSNNSITLGYKAQNKHDRSFIWNGDSNTSYCTSNLGQFKVCPTNGIQNFFIGDNAIISAILAEISKNETYKAKLKEILEL